MDIKVKNMECKTEKSKKYFNKLTRDKKKYNTTK